MKRYNSGAENLAHALSGRAVGHSKRKLECKCRLENRRNRCASLSRCAPGRVPRAHCRGSDHAKPCMFKHPKGTFAESSWPSHHGLLNPSTPSFTLHLSRVPIGVYQRYPSVDALCFPSCCVVDQYRAISLAAQTSEGCHNPCSLLLLLTDHHRLHPLVKSERQVLHRSSRLAPSSLFADDRRCNAWLALFLVPVPCVGDRGGCRRSSSPFTCEPPWLASDLPS